MRDQRKKVFPLVMSANNCAVFTDEMTSYQSLGKILMPKVTYVRT